MIEELGMKGSMGFNPGNTIGNPISNAPVPMPMPKTAEGARREKILKGGQRVCAECKFSREVVVGNMECHVKAFESRDRVTGEPVTVGWMLCSIQRSEELDFYLDYCGIAGRFFEPKEPK
ncbi:hypothetical protein AWB73_00109 [Caballeronia turbans]|nr:hypothetical protein AWB73_00109 [Caballeronia turbans]